MDRGTVVHGLPDRLRAARFLRGPEPVPRPVRQERMVHTTPPNPTTVTSPLRFSVLGPLSAEVDGHALPLGPLKQRVVLAALLCHANSPVSVALLTKAVWDDDPPRTARKNLQLYVSALRKTLALAGTGDRISLHCGGYVLRVAASELDSLDFLALARAGREALADGDAARAARLLHEARTLWNGPPLPGLGCSEVLEAEADRLTLRHLGVCEDWAEASLAAGRPGEVADAVGELVDEHPLRERLRAAQMTALHRSGRRGEAMAAYDELRQHLSRELGLSPSPALESLYRTVLADEGVAPTPATRSAAPVGLPADLPDFTGRGDTLAQLLETATGVSGAAHVLVGPAGVGKTTLAVRAAHRLEGEFPGGRIFVGLRQQDGGARSLGSVTAELLAYTGLVGAPPADPELAAAQWRDWLADRRVLVVLDDAPHEAAVRPLLPGPGRSTVLVTARTQLAGLAPAHRVRVPPLSTAEALELLGRLIGTGRMLCDRAAAARVVAACGALPLTVRAAGLKLAVLQHLPLAEYAERLADPEALLDELAVGDLQVRSHVADEWAQLADRHRGALRRLARLPLSGWFTAAEAATALGGDRRGAQRELELMIEAGAVVLPDSEVTAHTAAYSLPYLTHLYAREAAGV
ncbi:BTAD domain-containing putative transcriptional regulator [Streptomyces sp. NPDC091219]|uniref:AfsR/SARP family transcriptional regulator n=1 Tax=Streptomyces sp. NPDC091219 TaxID=3155193 RepID=UPI0034508A8A